MNEILLNKDLTVNQLVNFICAIRRCDTPEGWTLSELITKCFNDEMMFGSWFNNIDVME